MVRWRLKEVMNERGMNLRTVSRLSGVSYSTVRALYHNTQQCCLLSTLVKIANALHVSCETLMEMRHA